MSNEVTRRAFLSRAAVATGLAATAFAAGCAPHGAPEPAAKNDETQGWDEEVDFVVVGSGTASFAALAAAHAGARVALIEKANVIGGTTSLSGLVLWVPCNSLTEGYSEEDSPDKALTYMKAIDYFEGSSEDVKRDYVDNASKVFEWVAKDFGIPLVPNIVNGYGDYHNAPGQILFGRSIGFSLDEGATFCIGTPFFQDFMASELESAGVNVLLSTEATELVVSSDGSVAGIVARKGSDEMRIRAEKGVLLGAGGFEHNGQMRKAFLAGPIVGAQSATTNTGDGQRMGMRIGAALRSMGACWSVPFYDIAPEGELSTAHDWNNYGALPGAIIVNRAGRRFMDEAVMYGLCNPPYWMAGNGSSRLEASNLPAYLICDQTHVDYYGYPTYAEEPLDFVESFSNLKELADAMGIDAEGLADEVERFNGFCETGQDLDFQRGDWLGERMGIYSYSGVDTAAMAPEERIEYLATSDGGRPDLPYPWLAPVSTPPFYAVPIGPGTIGTSGGLAVNVEAQVLDREGSPIEGLYSCGNNASAICGGAYPGAGATVAPGIYQGIRAINHALGLNII